MKKAYLLIIAAALAFAGCSKVGSELPSDPDAWKWDESLPVPIMFGTPETEVMTKAGVSELADMEEIGIVGLDYWSTGWKAISEHNPGSISGEKSSSVLIDALQPARIDDSGNITFSKTPYYPISGSQNFTFYGFYPYSNVIYMGGSSRYYADLTIDGKTDVLWAEAKAEDFIFEKEDDQLYKIKGYNAAYIRRISEYNTDANGKSSDEYMPKLKFERKLTNLTFKLRVYESEWEGLCDANAAVTGLSVTSYTQFQMTVADRRDYDADGNPTFTEKANRLGGKLKPIEASVRTMDLSEVTPVKFEGVFENSDVKEDENGRYREFEFGDALLLYPSENYPSVLTITQGTGEDIKTVSSSLNLTLGEGKSFQEGKKHILTIIIKKPEEITMKAEAPVEWEDGDDNIIDPMNPSNETPVN